MTCSIPIHPCWPTEKKNDVVFERISMIQKNNRTITTKANSHLDQTSSNANSCHDNLDDNCLQNMEIFKGTIVYISKAL